MFNVLDFVEFGGHPGKLHSRGIYCAFEATEFFCILCSRLFSCLSEHLEISVNLNKFVCNEKMNWIKIGEKQGWIKWSSGSSKIFCENYPNMDWDDINALANTTCELWFLLTNCVTPHSNCSQTQDKSWHILHSQIPVQLGH